MARKMDMGDGKKISKAFAYRDAATVLGEDADLDAVHNHIKEKFGIEMNKTQISQYRSNEKKRKPRRGRKPKALSAAATPAPKASRNNTGNIIDFMTEVKGWEKKLSADEICQVIDILYKSK